MMKLRTPLTLGIIFAIVLVHSTVYGDEKERKINLTKKERCVRSCPSGRECQIQSDGTEVCVCASQCKKRHKPVCGTDGRLYINHCELHRAACVTGKKIRVDWGLKCLKKQAKSKDCTEENLLKMKQLILATFQIELHKEATSKILIDELFFRYNRDGDDSVSSFELKSLVTDYVMYKNIKELADKCHPTQWFNTADKNLDGLLSKDEFSQSLVAASKPEVSIKQNDEHPMSDSSLTLWCRVRGYPAPTITWFKDEKQLNANDRISTNPDGELTIKGLRAGDNGMYTCEASNELGVDRKQVVISVQEPVTEAPAVPGSNLFYAFANDGVYVINPETSSTVNHIGANDVINATTSPICTGGRQQACNWGGAVNVGVKYIYAADFLGRRVLVMDIATQKFVQEITTNDYPYQLKYVRSLDAVWILCWENSTLDVLTEDEDDNGTLWVINDASKVTVHKSIKAQIIDSYPRPVHGFFLEENCELTDQETKYGYVTHIMESGLHEVDLATKQYSKFFNLSDYQCHGTFDLALSQLYKYAFIQCYTNEERDTKAQIVMDLERKQMIAVDSTHFGSPFTSPDGRFIITLNYYAILTRYIDPAGQIYLFQEIESNLLLSDLAFYPRDIGYDVYVTSKDQSAIIVLHVDQRGIHIVKFISTVGKPSSVRDWVHTQRPIVTGCRSNARYLATPATREDAVVIIDGERQEMRGMVQGIKGVRTIAWVGGSQQK